ncbi:MAG TPA: carboxypeptidase regulatory-like domain-containing protein [Verrucomicrobiae bacterium]|nr:carboxypeptidase regulatory-like domain-containing protein [Verrucomicrobiae bacterium]
MKISSLVLLMAGLVATQITRAADITGVITLKGTPPKEVEITPIMDNPDCAAMYNGKTPTTHFYVVGPKGEFADVVVSLKDASGNDLTGKSTGASAKPAVLDQKGCLYHPGISAIQTGQKLIVKNSDNCIHNVHTTSKAGNPEHNDAQMPGGADLIYTFNKPETLMKFQCDVHPWMFAWVSIFDNPYFCVSDQDGKFTIKNVPPGKYTIEANHRKLGAKTQTVEVAGKDVTVNFTFDVK